MATTKRGKVKEFFVRNKKRIAYGAGLTVGAVAAVVLGKRYRDWIRMKSEQPVALPEAVVNTVTDDVFKSPIGIGTVTDAFQTDFGPELIINDVTLGQMGELGEKLVENVQGNITPDTIVTMSLGILPNLTKEQEAG